MSSFFDRRSFLLGALSSLATTGCARCSEGGAPNRSPPPPITTALPPNLAANPPSPESDAGVRGRVKTETWTIGSDGRAVVIVPAWMTPDEKLPMLIALHGRGEALKGPDKGVLGWPEDYALLRAIERVCAPPLTTEDFETFVEAQHLRDVNESLAKRQFAGLVVVCPYSPDVDLRKQDEMRGFSDYVMRKVIPKAQKELPILGTPGSIGIDGVSLGGALALRIGLWNATSFGAVGTLQPAIGEDQVAELTELARAARAKNASLKLRLLTSKEDYFKRAIKLTDSAWKSAGVEHDFEDLPGPHDYPFNRGPGAIEMLLWHDRLLARV